MKYIVSEIQTWDTGAVTTADYAYDSQDVAESKYHKILSAAAVSTLPKYSAILMTDQAFPLEHKCYVHETTTEE